MSRMDRWAGQAMVAFIVSDHGQDHDPKELVRHAWKYASLMEAERKRHMWLHADDDGDLHLEVGCDPETIVRGSGGSQAVV